MIHDEFFCTRWLPLDNCDCDRVARIRAHERKQVAHEVWDNCEREEACMVRVSAVLEIILPDEARRFMRENPHPDAARGEEETNE